MAFPARNYPCATERGSTPQSPPRDLLMPKSAQKNEMIMEYILRDYQQAAVDRAVEFFRSGTGNGLVVLPTGAGKSLVIAAIAKELDEPVLVFQPSKEILEQNYAKMCSYTGGVGVGIFSASAGRKEVCRITFATIGSVRNCKAMFLRFRYCIIDECHNVNAIEGMYKDFIEYTKCKVIGLTATPYRLSSNLLYGSILKFLTRTRPRVFDRLIYYVQVKELLQRGYLAQMNYYPVSVIDQSKLRLNSTGAEFSDASVRAYYNKVKFADQLKNIVQRLLNAGRTSILVFTKFTNEAEHLAKVIEAPSAVVTGETPKAERERILEAFKAKEINVVANVGVLTTGFDYPGLDTVVLARPTMSLALYYQMCGRAIRPYKDKVSWIVDLCGNYERFGRVDDLMLTERHPYQYAIESNGKQLTNVYFNNE